jgi:DNA-binding NtrC family response regulator/tetratricopeptide (TPR) repeat protein
VLTFRSEAATIMAPETCPGAVSTTIEGDRVEFLTEYFEILTPEAIQDDELPELFETVFKTLSRFDAHRFRCGDLFPQAIGRGPGRTFLLLPNAYILPFYSTEGSLTPSTGLRIDLGSGGRSLDRGYRMDSGRVHTMLVRKLISHILTDGARQSRKLSDFARGLLDTSDAISGGDILDLDDAYQKIFGRAPVKSLKTRSTTAKDSAKDPSVEARVDQLLDYGVAEGSVTLIRGDSYTGKSDILEEAAALLDRSEDYRVLPLDEWDLFTRTWKKAARGKSTAHNVWLIDDIDEKALAYSDFSTFMLASPGFPKGSVVMSARSAGIVHETEEFLTKLRAQRGDQYHEIVTGQKNAPREEARLASFLRSAIRDLDPVSRVPDDSPQRKLVQKFLRGLQTEERQLLEFMAVARFSMPFDLVHAVFSESSQKTYAAILHLTALDCLDLVYRRIPAKNVISIFLRIESTALRRLVYENISEQRRRKLHRTVALLAEQQDTFPKYLLLFHCLKSKESSLAARHAVAYLKETTSEQRHPYLVSLCVDLARAKTLEILPFADRVLVHHELSLDLLREGRGDEAEELLERSLELIDAAENDQKLKNAPRLSATFRLLADQWEARGDFKRALGLLEQAREELQSALPIPDQAQLLNDLGWVQYRLGDYDKSMESCRLSLNTLNATQYPLIVAQALNLMGVVHFNTSRYDEAISYYEQSAQLRERAGDENSLAASFNNLALAYQSKGEIEKAFDYHDRSLKLKTRQKNKAGIAAGYLNLAFLYLEARNFREAEQKCRESLAICEELGNAQLAADNYTTLGDIALEDGDLEGAEHHYQESRRISHQREAINEEMGALRRLSSLCIKQERFAEAREHADAAFALVQRIGSRYENGQIEVILGDLELEQNRHREALEHYEKAASQFTALSKHRLTATVLSKIGLIHARTGNDFEARHHFDRAHEFVRADIGRELPEEFVELQQVLREHPARSLIAGKDSQQLLMAFYDLSAVTDYAMDRHEFVRKIIDVTRRIVDPIECFLALKTAGDRFALFDDSGERNPLPPPYTDALFGRTLLGGSVTDSRSREVADLLPEMKLTKGNAFACVPLKTMGEDLGCLLIYLDEGRLPLSNQDINFFTWLGRQIASNLKLMLHLNADVLQEGIQESMEVPASRNSQDKYRVDNLIGKSEAMRKIFRTLEKVGDTDAGILILGESGTGKSALAKVSHNNSPRRMHPFQEIHCAQIPHNLLESELFGHERGSFTGAVQRKPGLCEVANGGTLFLDDINVIPVETQTKLLHFLESKSFMRLGGTQKLHADVRIIAASNEDLEKLCREGKFREDLYYRLKVILIELPPLRERKDDMVAIALDYLKRSCSDKNIALKTLSQETIQLFQKAPWRGNVRELQNVLERIVVLSEEQLITPSALPEDFLQEVMGTSRQTHDRLDELVDEIVKLGNYSEANPLLRTLEALLAKRMVSHVEGKSRAASMLGISKPTLYARLRDYDKLH